jgi:large repetitive protein
VTSSGGPNYGMAASIGYFEKGASSFPASNGIILSTGSAMAAKGPNTTVQSSAPGWPGDSELEQILGGGDDTNDATRLEFDFVPQIDHISFDYVFASEEYDGSAFACTYSDVFAFILTDVETGVKKNLAVLPGTTTPVKVTSVHPAIPGSCPAANPQYFGTYYQSGDLLAPINFSGITVPLTAQSAVTPGKLYHIKLVIANEGDHALNSAVFIDAGSFNIGSIDSGYSQLTSSAGPVLCTGQSTILSINGSATLSYKWMLNGQLIPGATSNTYTATEAGTYTVNMAIPGNSGCSVEHSISIHSATSGTAPTLEDMWVYEIGSDGQAPFDLAAQAAAITSMTGYANMTVTFHATLADAQAGTSALLSPYVNTANPQVIYVRIQNPANSCYVVTQFSIGAVDENYQTPPPTGPGVQGFAPGDTLADIIIAGDNIQWYDNPGSDADGNFTTDNVDTPLPLTTLLVDGMTYYASQTRFGRESVQRLAVTIDSAMNTENVNFKNFSYGLTR